MQALAQWGTVAFSALSAACWFRSSIVRVRMFGITPIGGSTRIHDGGTVAKQSWWNMLAAALAGVSAALMAVSSALGPGH